MSAIGPGRIHLDLQAARARELAAKGTWSSAVRKISARDATGGVPVFGEGVHIHGVRSLIE